MKNKKIIFGALTIVFLGLFFGIQYKTQQYNSKLSELMKLNICNNILVDDLNKIEEAKKNKNIKQIQMELMRIHKKRFIIMDVLKSSAPQLYGETGNEKRRIYALNYIKIKDFGNNITEAEEKNIHEISKLEIVNFMKSQNLSKVAIADLYMEAMDSPNLLQRQMTTFKK
jgi:hypothetical protein